MHTLKQSLQLSIVFFAVIGVGCLPGPQVSPSARPTLIQTSTKEVAAPNIITQTSLYVLATPTPYGCPGGSILFESYDTNSNQEPQYYDVCADGSRLQAVTVDPMSFLDNLSPDRKTRVWVADEKNAVKITDATGQTIIVILADSLEKGKVHEPSWSTDGEYVSYLKETVSADGISFDRLDMVHVRTGTITRGVVPNDQDPGWDWVSWSPSSNKVLLFSRQRPLYLGDVSCDKITYHCVSLITSIDVNKGARKFPWQPWSRDGLHLAYVCYSFHSSGEITKQGLCIQDTNGNLLNMFMETELGVKDIDYLTWSSDGASIVFTAYPVGKDERNVYILSLHDGALLNLSSTLTGHQESPIWIP